MDFTISQGKFSEAVKQMTKARTSEPGEFVDILCSQDSVRFVVTGREFSCVATVASLGAAQLPIELLPRMRKIAASFKGDIMVRIETGRVKINSMSLSSPHISLKLLANRLIDVPDGAPARDLLALRYLFSDVEIADSNLAGRVLEAESKLQVALKCATCLTEFGITRDQISALVESNLKAHAQTLRRLVLSSRLAE